MRAWWTYWSGHWAGSLMVRHFRAFASHRWLTWGFFGSKPLMSIRRRSFTRSALVSSTHAVQVLGRWPLHQWWVRLTSSMASNKLSSEISVSKSFPALFIGIPPFSCTGFPALPAECTSLLPKCLSSPWGVRLSVPRICEVGNIKKEAAADVPVIVRRAVVVDVEQTIVGVVAIVTTDVEARVRRAEVPVIARGLRTKNTGNAQTVPYKVQRLTARLSAGGCGPLRLPRWGVPGGGSRCSRHSSTRRSSRRRTNHSWSCGYSYHRRRGTGPTS